MLHSSYKLHPIGTPVFDGIGTRSVVTLDPPTLSIVSMFVTLFNVAFLFVTSILRVVVPFEHPFKFTSPKCETPTCFLKGTFLSVKFVCGFFVL